MTKHNDSSPLELSFDDDDLSASPVVRPTLKHAVPEVHALGSPDDDGVKIYELKSEPADTKAPSLEEEEEKLDELIIRALNDHELDTTDHHLTLGKEIESAPLETKSFLTLALEEDDEENLSESLSAPRQQKSPSPQMSIAPAASAPTLGTNSSPGETVSPVQGAPLEALQDVEADGSNTPSPNIDSHLHHASAKENDPKNAVAPLAEPSTYSFGGVQSVTPTKPKKKIPLSTWMFAGSIVFGSIFIIAVNIMLFQPRLLSEATVKPNARVPLDKGPVPALVASDAKETKKKVSYSGTQDNGDQHLEFEGVVDPENSVFSFKVTITTPKPKPLTIEQVGRHETPPTWIKKIETDRLNVVTDDLTDPESSKTMNLPLRIYYEKETERSRLITNGTITITKHADNIIDFNVQVPNDPQILLTPVTLTMSKSISF